ncbi:PspA/IM30 family protein [bacterium]|nr:PspA/IM30 family protein [bacterium]
MNRLRIFATRITAHFDWLVRQVENHEALVSSTLDEMSRHAANAKVQRKRVQRDGRALRERLVELQKTVALWEDRARTAKSSDEQKALACLQRKKRAEKECEQVEAHLLEHARMEEQLKHSLETIEEKLAHLRRERNIMRSRESSARALASFPKGESEMVADLSEIFERWDTRVTSYEMRGESYCQDIDELEESFSQEEEQQALREELAAL